MDAVADSCPADAAPENRPPRPALVRDLGRQAYEPVWRAMQRFTDQRADETTDELWVVEHDPVFTLGQAGKDEHVLAPGAIPVLHVDRGGQVTYHGPGQVVAYPLVDLRRMAIYVKEYVFRIEAALIDTLADYGVTGHRVRSSPGIYVRLADPFGQRREALHIAPGMQRAVGIAGPRRIPAKVPGAHPVAGFARAA